MSTLLDPMLAPLYALLIWPIAKSAVFVAASAVSVLSRNPDRRAAARRLLRAISDSPIDRPE